MAKSPGRLNQVRHRLHGHSTPGGETIERVRTNELVTTVAFLGRRRRVYSRLVALSGARTGDQVLDVGCSGGYLARLLAAAVGPGGRVTGIDPSVPAITYARRRGPDTCSYAVGVAEDLDLSDRSFDVVTTTLAVHHIAGAARPAAFAEMRRVARPGARLLVADFRPSRRHRAGGGRRHTSVPLDELVAGAGFRVEARGELPLLAYVQAVRPHP